MASNVGDNVSPYLLCLIMYFGVELDGAALDDSVALWTYERVAIASLAVNESNMPYLHKSLCVIETFVG